MTLRIVVVCASQLGVRVVRRPGGAASATDTVSSHNSATLAAFGTI